MSKPPNTEHNNCIIRINLGQRAFDRMIGCQRCVTQRRCFGGIQCAERNKKTFVRNEHVFGHSAIITKSASKSRLGRPVLTIVFRRELTGMTVSASPRSINRNGISFLQTSDTGAGFCNPACIFMAQCKRWFKSQLLFHYVQVGMANTGGSYFDYNLAGPRFRFWNILNFCFVSYSYKSHSFHADLLIDGCPEIQTLRRWWGFSTDEVRTARCRSREINALLLT